MHHNQKVIKRIDLLRFFGKTKRSAVESLRAELPVAANRNTGQREVWAAIFPKPTIISSRVVVVTPSAIPVVPKNVLGNLKRIRVVPTLL